MILVPFFIVSCLLILLLGILYFAPHFPLNKIFGPIITELFGSDALSYPDFYIFLIKIFNNVELIVAVVVGSLTTAMAVFLVSRYDQSEKLNLGQSFRVCWKRYLVLVLAVGLAVFCLELMIKMPHWLFTRYFSPRRPTLLWLDAKIWAVYIMPVINFLIIAVTQALFVFVIPFLVIKNKGLIRSLFLSIWLSIRKFYIVLPLVIFPLFLYLPFSFLKNNTLFLLNRMTPELVIVPLLIGSIFVNNLIIDAFVTLSVTIFFLQVTEDGK